MAIGRVGVESRRWGEEREWRRWRRRRRRKRRKRRRGHNMSSVGFICGGCVEEEEEEEGPQYV